MWDLLYVVGFICFGMGCGFLLRKRQHVAAFFGQLTMWIIYLLLFMLGLSLGRDAVIFSSLLSLGALSLVLACLCCAGSVVCVLWLKRFFVAESGKQSVEGYGDTLLATLKIFSCFVIGVVLGRIDCLPEWFYGERYTTYALFAMLYCVGIGLGADLKNFLIIKKNPGLLLAVPICTLLGTVLAAVVASFILPGFSVKDCVVSGCGLGYYTLASLLAGEGGDTRLAAIVLLTNIFRELLGVLSAPFVARYFGGIATVAVAGATATDTCLPVIARYGGERVAIVAVFSGMSATIAVPFLIIVALSLFG